MISAIINTCNEAKYLAQCLEHLTWADEIVIIDMYSTDKSVEIAKKYTDKIFYHEKTVSVLYARNYSLEKASGEWVLIVDPDEITPQSLAATLMEIARTDPPYSAVAIPRQMICFGKKSRSTIAVDAPVRFFKKGKAFFPARVHSHPVITGETHMLPYEEKYTMIHYDVNTVTEMMEKTNRYTSDEAHHLYQTDKKKFKTIDLLLKPMSKFVHRFIMRKGYRDGIEGLIFSVLMACYKFMVYAKLYELSKNNK